MQWPAVHGPAASPQLLAAESGCSVEAGLRRSHHSPSHQFLFFFFFFPDGDSTALSPLHWAPEVPGHQRVVASRPARRLPLRVRSHAPSAHSPGTQTGTETPSTAAQSCPSPAPASSCLTGRGAQSKGPHRHSPTPSLSTQWQGGGGGGLGPGSGPSSSGPIQRHHLLPGPCKCC